MNEETPQGSIGQRAPRSLGLQDRGIVELKHDDDDRVLMVFQITKNNEDLKNEGLEPAITNVVAVDKNNNRIGAAIILGQFYPGAPDNHTVFEPLESVLNFTDADVVFRVWRK
ncbi:hypothetical protein LCGC14_2317130 [marine sediment metagenome]|uniref:Uncharacterized protein n=1 Tax=marine sediment metagenome TaxID=412755 RepID=A0A0F9D6G7_9ZZZZ